MPNKRVLISVSDKTGIVDLCSCLVALGYEIVSTGGTANILRQGGISVIDVNEITKVPNMLDGRVKTLNNIIYGYL